MRMRLSRPSSEKSWRARCKRETLRHPHKSDRHIFSEFHDLGCLQDWGPCVLYAREVRFDHLARDHELQNSYYKQMVQANQFRRSKSSALDRSYRRDHASTDATPGSIWHWDLAVRKSSSTIHESTAWPLTEQITEHPFCSQRRRKRWITCANSQCIVHSDYRLLTAHSVTRCRLNGMVYSKLIQEFFAYAKLWLGTLH